MNWKRTTRFGMQIGGLNLGQVLVSVLLVSLPICLTIGSDSDFGLPGMT
jgi:hypothetical protein